jgi:hypothetical protein
MKSIKQYNLRGFSVGINDGSNLCMKYTIEMASGGMIHIASFMTIGSGIPIILWVLPQFFERL